MDFIIRIGGFTFSVFTASVHGMLSVLLCGVVCGAFALLDYYRFRRLDEICSVAVGRWDWLDYQFRRLEGSCAHEQAGELWRKMDPLRYTTHREASQLAHDWERQWLFAPKWAQRMDRLRRVFSPVLYALLLLVTIHAFAVALLNDPVPPEAFLLAWVAFFSGQKVWSVFRTRATLTNLCAYELALRVLASEWPSATSDAIVGEPSEPPTTKPGEDNGPYWSTPRAD